MINSRRLPYLFLVYGFLGVAYFLLFIWLGFPYVTSLDLGTLGPWTPSGAAFLLFYGLAFLLLAASFFCQLAAYGFLKSRNWAKKLGIVVSLPPAIGTLPAALIVMEIMSNWEYYDRVGINPSLTVRLWAISLFFGLINAALVYFLSGQLRQQGLTGD